MTVAGSRPFQRIGSDAATPSSMPIVVRPRPFGAARRRPRQSRNTRADPHRARVSAPDVHETKAPRSARGAQQHRNAFANVANRATHWSPYVIAELLNAAALTSGVRRREQERAKLPAAPVCSHEL